MNFHFLKENNQYFATWKNVYATLHCWCRNNYIELYQQRAGFLCLFQVSIEKLVDFQKSKTWSCLSAFPSKLLFSDVFSWGLLFGGMTKSSAYIRKQQESLSWLKANKTIVLPWRLQSIKRGLLFFHLCWARMSIYVTFTFSWVWILADKMWS